MRTAVFHIKRLIKRSGKRTPSQKARSKKEKKKQPCDGTAGCPAAGPCLWSRGRGETPVRGCSCPYRAKSHTRWLVTDQLSPSPTIPGHGCNKPPPRLTAHPKANTLPPQCLQRPIFALIKWKWGHEKAWGLWCFLATERESHQMRLRYWITGDLKREKVVFRSRTEHRLQVHVLATAASSMVADWERDCSLLVFQEQRHGSRVCPQRQRTQDCRLHRLHPTAALLTYLRQSKFGFMLSIMVCEED